MKDQCRITTIGWGHSLYFLSLELLVNIVKHKGKLWDEIMAIKFYSRKTFISRHVVYIVELSGNGFWNGNFYVDRKSNANRNKETCPACQQMVSLMVRPGPSLLFSPHPLYTLAGLYRLYSSHMVMWPQGEKKENWLILHQHNGAHKSHLCYKTRAPIFSSHSILL